MLNIFEELLLIFRKITQLYQESIAFSDHFHKKHHTQPTNRKKKIIINK